MSYSQKLREVLRRREEYETARFRATAVKFYEKEARRLGRSIGLLDTIQNKEIKSLDSID